MVLDIVANQIVEQLEAEKMVKNVHCMNLKPQKKKSSFINLTTSASSSICILGDFNAKHSSWWNGQNTDEAGKTLFDFASVNGLTQLVTGATRCPHLSSAAQLDLIFVNDISRVNSCQVLPQLSDHCPTLFSFAQQHQQHSAFNRSFMDYEKTDWNGLNNFLDELDWTPVLSATDPDQALGQWYRILSDAMQKFVPEKRIKVRPSNRPWYSPTLCRIRRQRDRLYQRFKKLPADHRLSVCYRRVRNWYVAELRNAEKCYYRNISSQLSKGNLLNNAHKWWSIAKKSCGLQTSDSLPPLRSQGQACLTALEKATCLNSTFAEQCSAPTVSGCRPVQQKRMSGPGDQATFSFQAIAPEDVFKRLSTLNVWKAPRIDGVCHRLLKNCAQALSSSLCHIFNISLQTGVFPKTGKTALIQPIFKNKGERSDARNYRPIALLPSVSKVFEYFAHKQLLDYCLEAGVIPDEQFGFLPKRSTVLQLLSVLEDIDSALDERKEVHACFFGYLEGI